jgi:2-polyprenyl-3-methyl-5-hydroxy-6-metoxy-1,4-benzoquinol methylase
MKTSLPPSQVQNTYFANAIQKTSTVSSERSSDIRRAKETFELNWGSFIRQLPALQSALDIGMGPGSFLECYKELGFATVTGIDRSIDCCRYVEQVKHADFQVVHSDAETYLTQFKNHFDLISAFHVLEHMGRDSFERLLEQVHGALKKEGLLILETPNMNYPFASYHLWGDPTHMVGYTPGALKTLLEANRFLVIAAGEKRNPPTSFLHRWRQKLANIYLHIWFPAKIYLLEGGAEMRSRENIFSPYFWIIAKPIKG